MSDKQEMLPAVSEAITREDRERCSTEYQSFLKEFDKQFSPTEEDAGFDIYTKTKLLKAFKRVISATSFATKVSGEYKVELKFEKEKGFKVNVVYKSTGDPKKLEEELKLEPTNAFGLELTNKLDF